MRLRNKLTGEIVDVNVKIIEYPNIPQGYPKHELYNSLAELNEEWEDAPEEPKEYWRIDCDGTLSHGKDDFDTPFDNACKSLGNYFETKEEAEKAVEKLKAWKRLKDKGFRFIGWTIDDGLRISICSNIDEEDIYDEDKRKMKPDLDLLFGGEE